MERLRTLALAAPLLLACDPGFDPQSAMDGDADPMDDGDADPMDDGDDPMDDGDAGFDNTFDGVVGALDGMTFYCNAGDAGRYNVTFGSSGALSVSPDDGGELSGTWASSGEALALDVPEAGYQEVSIEHEVELGLLLTFATPSMRCHAVALKSDVSGGATTLGCPTIKYIPSVGYEDNQFILEANGQARRRRWKELSGELSDTLYSEMYGVWVLDGDILYMAFGDGDPDEERLLVGRVTDEGLYIDQLEPEKGACTETAG